MCICCRLLADQTCVVGDIGTLIPLFSSSKAAECFFCGLSSDGFDTNRSDGFKAHEAEEHNMWAYLYFFAHLDAKPMAEYSQIELDVAVQLYKDDIDFYPIGRALSRNAGRLANDSAIELDDRVAQLQTAHETLRVQLALPFACSRRRLKRIGRDHS